MHSKEERLTHELTDAERDAGAAAMAELFHSIGFDVADESSYNQLVEYVEVSGLRTVVERGDAVLHGRCLKLGGGLEVWSVLYERGSDFYYADCRPAFRSRYFHRIAPWELIEFDEDGEAIVRGMIDDSADAVFELQNLTEINNRIFRDPQLNIALAGIAYWAEVRSAAGPGNVGSRFELAERLQAYAENACESDYIIGGRILAVREIVNPLSGSRLCWMFVDAGIIRLEVIANDLVISGPLRIGSYLEAGVWLQGHVLAESEISERYEGVDPDHEAADSWITLRRTN
jgi:hypothetical protein